MQHKKIICFVGGKSGGHIIPCLTLAQQYKNDTVLFFSTQTPLDQSLLHNHPLVTRHIMLPLGKTEYPRIIRYPIILWQIVSSFCTSLYYLYKNKPEKIISTGGLVAIPVCLAAKIIGIPVCLAAKIIGIPIELYELNATPGKAIKLLSPLANKINVCFKGATQFFPANKCVVTSYPVRFTHQIEKKEALEKMGLNPNKKTIFILGGSQGSVFLNTIVKDFFMQRSATDIQVIHQTGAHDKTNWEQLYKSHSVPAYVFSYTHDIAYCYAAADVIIGRAGAGALFETHFFNKKSIIIPLETRQNTHQYDNACAISQEYPILFTMTRQHEIEQNKSKFFDMITHTL